MNNLPPRLTFHAQGTIDIDTPVTWNGRHDTLRNIGCDYAFLNEFGIHVLANLGFNRRWLTQPAPNTNAKILSMLVSGSAPPINATGKFAGLPQRNVWFAFTVASEYLDQLPPKLNHMITRPGHPQKFTIDIMGFQMRILSANPSTPATALLPPPAAGFVDDDPAPARPETRPRIMGRGLLDGSGVIMHYTP